MCNRVVFINEGRLVFDGTPTELAEQNANLDERFHELTAASDPTPTCFTRRRVTRRPVFTTTKITES